MQIGHLFKKSATSEALAGCLNGGGKTAGLTFSAGGRGGGGGGGPACRTLSPLKSSKLAAVNPSIKDSVEGHKELQQLFDISRRWETSDSRTFQHIGDIEIIQKTLGKRQDTVLTGRVCVRKNESGSLLSLSSSQCSRTFSGLGSRR